MIKARNRKISMLLVLAMLMTMFVGIGTASAASSYKAGEPMNVISGTNPNFSNRIMVEVTPGSVSGDTYARFQLPSDFATTVRSISVDELNGVQIRMQNSNGTWTGWSTAVNSGNSGAVNLTGRVFELYIASGGADLSKTGRVAIDLSTLTVDSGFSGLIEVEFIAYPGSGLTSGKVAIAQAGSGAVVLSMESVKTITTNKLAVDKIYIKEDTKGALKTGTDGVELKLPSGFEWRIGSTSQSIIWGDPTVRLALSTKDSDRTLVIGSSALTDRATYFELSGLQIQVDDSIAKLGDINARITGKTSSTISELLVAKYGDFGVIVETVGDTKQVVAGKLEQEITAFRIKEGIAGSLIPTRNITLEIIGNAKWQTPPSLDTAKSKNTKLDLNWQPVGNSQKIIRTTVNNNSLNDAADMVFHRAELMIAPTAALDGEIKIKVTGNSGVEETTITVAKVVTPVMGKADPITDVRIGVADQKLSPIIITELVDEAIDARRGVATGMRQVPGLVPDPANPGQFIWGMVPEISRTNLNELLLVFPQGIVPKVGTMTVEVLEGDMNIDVTSRGVNKRDDGRWQASVTITSTSMTPAKLKFDNIYVSLDRTVPEGNVEVGITGSAVNQTINFFPGDIAVGSVVVAKAVTPAPGDVTGSGKFTIGSNIYTVNGANKVMDAAPYIKDSRTYVPMRYVAEIIGADVVWDDAARTVTLTKGDDVVVFTIGSTTYTVNGEAKTADVAPEIANSRTMLPARYAAEAFGALVGWDAASGTVLITK